MEDSTEIFNFPYWIDTAKRLKYSAEILHKQLVIIQDNEPDGDTFFEHNQNLRALLESEYLLLGYSVENLLKGYAIFKYKLRASIPENCDLTFLSGHIWKTSSGHELLSLAEACDLTFNDDEKESLKKLESHTIWRGRYHIPKAKDKIIKSLKPGVGMTYARSDRSFIDRLFDRVVRDIEE